MDERIELNGWLNAKEAVCFKCPTPNCNRTVSLPRSVYLTVRESLNDFGPRSVTCRGCGVLWTVFSFVRKTVKVASVGRRA